MRLPRAALGYCGRLQKTFCAANAGPKRTGDVPLRPETLEDRGPDCGKACYACLLDYGNQPDHKDLDRILSAIFCLTLASHVQARRRRWIAL